MSVQRDAKTYAVVDLEATGTGIDAKIIQIGIVMVENGRIRESFATDINPHEKLDPHIVQLTGITDQQLAQAPDFGQVAGQIFDLIGNAVFVAHNVAFDANLLAEALFFEGYELLTPRVDTVELSQLFFPTFDKYSLSNLSEQLGLGLDQAHTAIADARATAALLLAIQEKIATLSKAVLGQLLVFADHLLYESRLVIDAIYHEMTPSCPPDIELVHGLGLKKRQAVPAEGSYAEDFETNLAKLGLTGRPQQVQFAQLVEKGIADHTRVQFIQAQTGIGKTLGYLLPLLAKTEDQILLTVPTKVLQEQIMSKEARMLQEGFQTSLVSIKSPKHYIKLDHFWKVLQLEEDNRLANLFKMQVLVWLCQTETGDLTELKQTYRYPVFFDQLAHDGHLAQDSLFYEWDFWRQLQSRAVKSRVLLTNHAYLLSHVADQDPLMEGRILVMDEAQKCMLVAEEAASHTWSVTELLQSLQSKRDRASSLLEQRLYESCLFELNQLVLLYRQTGVAHVRSQDLQRLRQSLSELVDADLLDLEKLLASASYCWIEERSSAGKRQAYLRASREELLQPAVFLKQDKIFCISATLDVSPRVTLAELMGFKEARFTRLDRVKPNNQLVLLPEEWLDPRSLSQQDYAYRLLQLVKGLAKGKEPILILFTSTALLLALSDLLDARGIGHLAQHKHGEEASLKRRFDKGECDLLLGTGVFWEGVDFANQPQLIQLVTSLPFDHPKDRFVQKVNQFLRKEGKNPFYDYSLPMMLMKLQQALGRTNRSPQQASLVLLLDGRVLGKSYGRQVLGFLEDQYVFSLVKEENLLAEVNAFFKQC